MMEGFARPARLFLTSTLIASLTASLLCGVALGDDRSAAKSFPNGTTAFAPIGKVYSLGEISINGRRVYGEQMIWGAELLKVSKDASACVVLDSIGLVGLERGAELRAATTLTRAVSETGPILILSLISGNIFVKLQENASAYLEMCGAEFTTTRGASFYAEIRENQPLVTATKGVVEIFPSIQDVEYIVEPVVADPLTGRPTQPAPSTRRIPPSQPGTTQQQQVISVKVTKEIRRRRRGSELPDLEEE